MFEPVWDGDECSVCYNTELSDLIEGHDIPRFVKAPRIRWLGHVWRMSEQLMQKTMLMGRLSFRRRKGRSCTTWLDVVVMGVRGWRGREGDKAGSRRVVKEAPAREGL
jgi:hypothetical protein